MNTHEPTEAGERLDSWRRPRPATLAGLVLLALLVGLFACVSQWSPSEPLGRHRTAPIANAGAEIGADRCYDCHDSFEEHFVASEFHSDCESCHGPAQLHAYTARADDIRYPSSEDCAHCHQVGSKTLLGWTTSSHARVGVGCSDCHDTHDRELWLVRRTDAVGGTMLRHAGGITRMCVSCHGEVAAQFDLPSHHPMREGMLDCTDCHFAHENKRQTLGPPTQTCLGCHQEVAGPWVYEHPPVTEDCGYCHAAHGATADFLLETSQPAACISCHTVALQGAEHALAFSTDCTDCHNSIHGSYTDPHLRR